MTMITPVSKLNSIQAQGLKLKVKLVGEYLCSGANMHTRTDGRTTQKHNSTGPHLQDGQWHKTAVLSDGVKWELLDTVKARKLAYYGHTMRKQVAWRKR